MSRFRQLCATTLLAMLLATSALAGHLPQGITSPPPPSSETSATGDMPGGVTSSSDASVTGEMPQGITSEIDPVMEFTLGLLQSVLALF